MSQTEREPSDSTGRYNPGAFDEDDAAAAGAATWYARRERVLKDLGLWETWRYVPPKQEREKPLQAYLPGGEEYGHD